MPVWSIHTSRVAPTRRINLDFNVRLSKQQHIQIFWTKLRPECPIVCQIPHKCWQTKVLTLFHATALHGLRWTRFPWVPLYACRRLVPFLGKFYLFAELQIDHQMLKRRILMKHRALFGPERHIRWSKDCVTCIWIHDFNHHLNWYVISSAN